MSFIRRLLRLERYAQNQQTDWKDDGVIGLSGISGAPTKPTTVDVDRVRWRRVGDSMDVVMEWYAASTSGANDGGGDHLWQIPGGFYGDTNKYTVYTTDEGYGDWYPNGASMLGSFYAVTSGGSGQHVVGPVIPYNNSYVRLLGTLNDHGNLNRLGAIGAGNGWGVTYFSRIGLKFTIPIKGWTSKLRG